MKSFKHAHGTRNPILTQEEESILLTVKRALASSTNSQTIGRNGELPFLHFLERYLPSTLRATSGHFVTPSGKLSPQIDVIVVDARYPLLAENTDGSALVMLHSVVRMFEVKTNATTKDIKKSLAVVGKVMPLASEVEEFGGVESFASPHSCMLAYNCAHRLASLEKQFFASADPQHAPMDAVFLRYHPSDRESTGAVGGLLHAEPPFPEEGGTGSLPGGYFPLSIPMHTPLSDLYYKLVQDSYYTLGARNFSLSEIGAQFMHYMSWSTAL